MTELREITARVLSGDESVTVDAIREKISATQQASLGLFQKVDEKRSAEAASSESSSTEAPKEEKKDEPILLSPVSSSLGTSVRLGLVPRPRD